MPDVEQPEDLEPVDLKQPTDDETRATFNELASEASQRTEGGPDTRQLVDVPHLPEYDADFPNPANGRLSISKCQMIMEAKQYNRYADVFFQSGLDEEPADFSPSHYHEHKMSVDLWEELGRPMTITVTIQPGDHLNGPGEAQAQAEATGPVPQTDAARDEQEEGSEDRQ